MIYASCSQFWTNSQNGMKGCQFEQKTNCALCPFEITSPTRVIQMAWTFYSHLLLRRSKGFLPMISFTSTLWILFPHVQEQCNFPGGERNFLYTIPLSLFNPLHKQRGKLVGCAQNGGPQRAGTFEPEDIDLDLGSVCHFPSGWTWPSQLSLWASVSLSVK